MCLIRYYRWETIEKILLSMIVEGETLMMGVIRVLISLIKMCYRPVSDDITMPSLSNCCSAPILEDTDICAKCREHCEVSELDEIQEDTTSLADDMRPVAEGMNIIFNQALDNRKKKNYGQRAYDPEEKLEELNNIRPVMS